MQQLLEHNKELWIILIQVFLLYLFIQSIYLLITTITAIKNIKQQKKHISLSNRLHHEYYVPISILVPTYNSEKKIIKTVEELLKLDYHLYEIIVIDDASNDKTIKSLISHFHLHLVDRPIRRKLKTEEVIKVYQTSKQKIKITVLEKEHGGRADCLNAGLNVADFPYFVSISDTTKLEKNALEKLVNPILEDDKVLLSRGTTKVLSKEKRKLALGKTSTYNRAYHTLDNYPMANQFVLFAREFSLDVGGFDYIGENFELTRKIEHHCKKEKMDTKIKLSMDAVSYIELDGIQKGFQKEIRFSQSLIRGLFKYQTSIILSLYQLLYKILSFWFILIGVIATFISSIYSMTDMLGVYLFLLLYTIFNISLTYVLYIEMCFLEDKKTTMREKIKILFSILVESTIIRVYYVCSRPFSALKPIK